MTQLLTNLTDNLFRGKTGFAFQLVLVLVCFVGAIFLRTQVGLGYQLYSLNEIYIAELWFVALVVSLAGWGKLVRQQLISRIAGHFNLGLGLAASVVAFGIFSLIGMAKSGIAIGWVLTGLALYFIYFDFRPRSKPLQVNWLHLALIALAMLMVLSIVRELLWAPYFNKYDDIRNYFALIARMLETGSLGTDPYNDGRLITSLGGQYFIQALFVSVAHYESLWLIEPVLYMLAIMAVLHGELERRGATVPQIIGSWMAFIVVAAQYPYLNDEVIAVNTTSVFSFISLGLVLWVLLDQYGPELDFKGRIALGLVVTATLAMKNTNALGVFMVYALVVAADPKALLQIRWWQEQSITLVGAVVLLLPMMLSCYMSSGSLWFPFLGSGNFISHWDETYNAQVSLGLGNAVVAFFERIIRAPIAVGFLCISLLTAAISLFKNERGLVRLAVPALVVLISVLIFNSTGGLAAYRYMSPYLVLGMLIYPLTMTTYTWALNQWMVAGGLLALLGLGRFDRLKEAPKVPFNMLIGQRRGPGPVVGAEKLAQYKQLNKIIPRGGKVLAWVSNPHLLDFGRAEIDLLVAPGMASPDADFAQLKTSKQLLNSVRNSGYTHLLFDDKLYPTTVTVQPKPYYWKYVSHSARKRCTDLLDSVKSQLGIAASLDSNLLVKVR